MTEKIRYTLKEILLLENLHDCDEFMMLRENPLKLIDRGYEYLDRGEYAKAFNLFKAGVEIDRSDPDILNGIGIALCEMGHLKEAKKVLEYAIAANPEDPIIYANMAGVMWEECDYDSAIFYYSKSIEIDSDIEETFFNLINLYMETGMLFMALITCGRFIEQFPENKEALALRDDIILNLGLSII
ncbi:MAG TPA: tetratricopeptide repeat protein [Spirochaetota bacterium]|nr:tetratricopeptide repeat protein [Spirochaetota bacterium]HPJ34776.1 tetratricopeptide repeat protein [Spirochaetota bacterium]